MTATWPAQGLPQDAEAVERFEEIQGLVRGRGRGEGGAGALYLDRIWTACVSLSLCGQIRSIRNARAEYQVAPSQRIAATVVASAQSQPFIEVHVRGWGGDVCR